MKPTSSLAAPLAIVAILLSIAAIYVGAARAPQAPALDSLGASERTTITNPWTFTKAVNITAATDFATTTVNQFTQGGDHCTLTDANGGTYVLTQAELAHCSVLTYASVPGQAQAVIALTTPATSTLTSLLPNAGDMRTWVYDASALAAATTTTWTAGTGINQIAYTTNDDVIDGGEYSELKCWREADTDVSCIVSELVASD